MVATLATSCQKEDLPGSSEQEQQADVAYVSIAIDAPKSRAGIVDGSTEEGEGDENKIFSLALVSFDKNYDFIGSTPAYVENGVFKCEVAPDARRFFAVVNPTTEIWTAINAVSSLNQSAFSSLPAIVTSAAAVSTGNMQSSGNGTRGFTMVNSGVKNTSGILLEALVSITTELSEDINNPTPVTIPVDRLVAKFEYAVTSSFKANTESQFGEAEDNAVGEVIGVALTATNKATNLYSMILTDKLVKNNIYRTDHNMTVGQALTEASDIIDALNDNFHWLENADEATDNAFIAPNETVGEVAQTPIYVLENTCLSGYSNSNNLTQAIVKAKYNPTMSNGDVLDLGTSWFKMLTTTGDGTLRLTFDEVVELYNDEYAGFAADAATKTSMDIQLNNILGTTDKTWADDDVTLELLDASTYGGYKAATVDSQSNYVLQYYQNAINYYDIFISHDDSQPISHDGRWGMVRNNSYTMDITGIAKEGLPYIPDPTDPEIVDPDNKKPTDPEPADKLKTYIGVSIDVKDWVLWTQESPLM